MDVLDRIYRERIGPETWDLLLEHGIALTYSLKSEHGPHIAYGRMGGWEAHHDGAASRTLVGSGETQEASVRALVEGSARLHHAPNLKSSLWAFGEACELLAGAYQRG